MNRGISQQDSGKLKEKSTSMTGPNNNNKADLKNFIKSSKMIQVLNKKGIQKLLPVQSQTFHIIYKGEDVVAKDRTGSGKTIAFSLPIVERMRQQGKFRGTHFPKFLIVLPTRQLSIQVRDQIESLRYRDEQDFQVVSVYGGSNNIQSQIKLIQRGADIITGTPGRIIDLMNRNVIILDYFEVICLDEADQMLKIDFKTDIESIFKFVTKSRKKKIQCLMFSATIPSWIWQMSDLYQSQSRHFIDMIKDDKIKTSKTVKHFCLYSDQSDKQYYIAPIINFFMWKKTGKIIVFCETKRDVDRIGRSRRIPASVAMLHGDFTQFQREKVFQNFKFGQIQCLIATNVAARGLDFPEIDLIIQLQPPTTTESYIHRSGRTGRVGRDGVCVTMYSYNQEHLMERIQRQASLIFSHIDPRDLQPVDQSYKNEYFDSYEYDTRKQNRNQISESSSNRNNNNTGRDRDRDRGNNNRKYQDQDEYQRPNNKYEQKSYSNTRSRDQQTGSNNRKTSTRQQEDYNPRSTRQTNRDTYIPRQYGSRY